MATTRIGKQSSPPQTEQNHFRDYYQSKIQNYEQETLQKTQNLRRLEAQRNQLNAKVRLLKEELSLLQEPGSSVAEMVKVMDK